jgi:uncharacterized membrane protein
MRSRPFVPVSLLVAASGWCVFLIAVRRYEYGAAGYHYLVWNLTLAWVPFVLALVLRAAYKRRAHWAELVAVGCVWLLFLPNAPYMLTDFVHLEHAHRVFNAIILGSFAFTALALGLASVLLVQLVVTRLAGPKLGWALAVGALFASSVGIYIGRVLRLNSWDVIERPRTVWTIARIRLDDPFGNRHLIVVVLALCAFLTVAYVGLYGFNSLLAAVGREDRTQ